MNSFNLQVLNLFTSMQSHPTPILTVDDVTRVGPIGFDVTFHSDARLTVFVFLGVSCCQCVHRRLLLETVKVFKVFRTWCKALCAKTDYFVGGLRYPTSGTSATHWFNKNPLLTSSKCCNQTRRQLCIFLKFSENPCEIKENLVCRKNMSWMCHW